MMGKELGPPELEHLGDFTTSVSTRDDEEERTRKAKAYLICQERGHNPSGKVLTVDPPWQVCKWCGTAYLWTRELVEMDPPIEGE